MHEEAQYKGKKIYNTSRIHMWFVRLPLLFTRIHRDAGNNKPPSKLSWQLPQYTSVPESQLAAVTFS